MAKEGQFYRDRSKRLEKKGVARESARFAQQIRTVDTLVNALELELESQGLNKSELARLVRVEPANIRRLFRVTETQLYKPSRISPLNWVSSYV